MKPARRFAFGHAPPPVRAPQQAARNEDQITAPLPDCVAPATSPWQGRPTLPLAEHVARATPVLPFRATLTAPPQEIAPAAPPP